MRMGRAETSESELPMFSGVLEAKPWLSSTVQDLSLWGVHDFYILQELIYQLHPLRTLKLQVVFNKTTQEIRAKFTSVDSLVLKPLPGGVWSDEDAPTMVDVLVWFTTINSLEAARLHINYPSVYSLPVTPQDLCMRQLDVPASILPVWCKPSAHQADNYISANPLERLILVDWRADDIPLMNRFWKLHGSSITGMVLATLVYSGHDVYWQGTCTLVMCMHTY